MRVRYSPSPTADLALPSIRIAVFNWLFARSAGGTFVLRIENLDAPDDKGEAILDGLRWCGLSWDEGPHYESDRRELYERRIREIGATGRVHRREDGAQVFHIENEEVGWDDVIHGPSDRLMTEDVVLVRPDGRPTYNFTCVVDDHEMEITHVMRSEDFFANTGIHIALYRAFGWVPPRFALVPHAEDQHGETFSRSRAAEYEKIGLPYTVSAAKRMGYLPEAIVNFVALLGWDAPEDAMSLDEMAERFSMEHFDDEPERASVRMLKRLNAFHLQACAPDRLIDLARTFVEATLGPQPPDRLREALLAVRPRMRRLDEAPALVKDRLK